MACLSIGNAVETCQTGNRKCTENVECLFVGNAAGEHDVLVNRKYNRKCGLLKSWECYRKYAISIVAGNVARRMACPHHRKLHILVLEMWNFKMRKLRPIPYYPAPGNFQISYMFPVLRNATQYMTFQINVLHHSFRWKFHFFCSVRNAVAGRVKVSSAW